MQADSSEMRRPLLALLAIVVLGLLVRLPGQLYPATLHYDEGAEVSGVLCAFPPYGAHYHPFLSRYLLSIPEDLLCVLAKLRGAEHPLVQTRAAFQLEPMPFIHIGRAIALFFGLAAILVTYLLGRAVGGVNTGLIAAFFLAVSPAHIIVSNNLRPWALASLLTVSVLLALKDVVQPQTPRRKLAIAGALAGLALATVYALALVAVPMLVALALRWRTRRQRGEAVEWARDLGVVIAAGLVAHLLGNLSGVLAVSETMKQFWQPTASMLSDTAGGIQNSVSYSYLTNVRWYFEALLDPFGLGAVVALAGLLGIVIAARLGNPMWLVMIALVAGVLLVQPLMVILMANRYTIPAVAALVIAAGWLVTTVDRSICAKWPALARVRPAAVLALLMALPSLMVIRDYHRALALAPTRELARQWFEANVQQGTSVVQSIPYISPVLADCKVVAQSANPKFQRRRCYDVRYTPTDEPWVVLDYLKRTDATYLIYTSATPIGTMRRLGSTDASAALRQRYELLARFEHPALDRFHDDTATVNPLVEIYRLAR